MLTDKSIFITGGTGEASTIRELAEVIAEVVGYTGSFVQDFSKPDGSPRKLLDISKIKKLGWIPKTGLREGISKSYENFLQ